MVSTLEYLSFKTRRQIINNSILFDNDYIKDNSSRTADKRELNSILFALSSTKKRVIFDFTVLDSNNNIINNQRDLIKGNFYNVSGYCQNGHNSFFEKLEYVGLGIFLNKSYEFVFTCPLNKRGLKRLESHSKSKIIFTTDKGIETIIPKEVEKLEDLLPLFSELLQSEFDYELILKSPLFIPDIILKNITGIYFLENFFFIEHREETNNNYSLLVV